MTWVDYGACYAGPGPLDVCSIRSLYTPVSITWGGIKALYNTYYHFDGAVALSGESNTIAWNHLPNDTARTYFVYRGEGTDEELTLLGTTFGDSLFIDDDVELGKEYRYHVASTDSTTLLDIGLGHAGLKQVSSTILEDQFPDLNYDQAIAAHGNRLFVASLNRIVRLDASDPSNPVVTGSRTDAAFDSSPKQLALSPNGSKLYVVTDSGFAVLDATSPGLAVLGGLWNMIDPDGGDDFMADIAVVDDIVYLTCGAKGIYAIDVWNPARPAVAGVHDPAPSSLWAVGIEAVGPYLYATYVDWSPEPHRAERLVANKTLAPPNWDRHWDVTFSVDCSTGGGCFDDDLWMSSRGKVRGAVSVCHEEGNFVATNLALPKSPRALRALESLGLPPDMGGNGSVWESGGYGNTDSIDSLV